jgi:hypothetical protein
MSIIFDKDSLELSKACKEYLDELAKKGDNDINFETDFKGFFSQFGKFW